MRWALGAQGQIRSDQISSRPAGAIGHPSRPLGQPHARGSFWQVRHGELSFCFIYKFRQRFGVVADAICRGLGRDTATAVEQARKMNMFLDDFACCQSACGEACCGTLKQAKDVERGETIWVAAGGGGADPAPQRIAATTRVEAKGLHSPVLTHGAFPLIEEACVAEAACSRAGVVTAFDSLGYVDLASYGVPLLEPICEAMGMCSAVRRLLLGSGGSYVQIR